MQKILIVEDERDVADLIRLNLEDEGYAVVTCGDANTGIVKALREHIDLMILDIMLPGMDGFEAMRHLKQDTRSRGIPVIMLTARANPIDRIKGLELGAEDYVVKPFSPRELCLRVKAVLGRIKRRSSSGEIRRGPFKLNRYSLVCELEGQALELTPTEFKLLTVLLEREGMPQERDALLREVWNYSDRIYSRTLDTHIRRLREKLGRHADAVRTIRGVGYAFVWDDDSSAE